MNPRIFVVLLLIYLALRAIKWLAIGASILVTVYVALWVVGTITGPPPTPRGYDVPGCYCAGPI